MGLRTPCAQRHSVSACGAEYNVPAPHHSVGHDVFEVESQKRVDKIQRDKAGRDTVSDYETG
jgi:hypothetical protein